MRSLASREFEVLIAKMKPADLDKLGQAVAEGKLHIGGQARDHSVVAHPSPRISLAKNPALIADE
jgi:hypothetical protein